MYSRATRSTSSKPTTPTCNRLSCDRRTSLLSRRQTRLKPGRGTIMKSCSAYTPDCCRNWTKRGMAFPNLDPRGRLSYRNWNSATQRGREFAKARTATVRKITQVASAPGKSRSGPGFRCRPAGEPRAQPFAPSQQAEGDAGQRCNDDGNDGLEASVTVVRRFVEQELEPLGLDDRRHGRHGTQKCRDDVGDDWHATTHRPSPSISHRRTDRRSSSAQRG